ncbi:penicillin-binding protein 2 [Luteolibacter pohnpeiensis]|uniref:Penicillin-binding protein 2 n=1 Tax=Luteolibacter pohnpeiensis TaxID=454153 RepID=A0A934VVD9_9BACT|nr:penicillin-binding protein 2 [Luteolibacter pohnpeiensis]MBK1883462.1 penicillin-binding protein 2 [Luteolibacter pohnpeiensis]
MKFIVTRQFQSRCIVLCSVLVAGLSALSARLVQIQLVEREHYAEQSSSVFERRETLPAIRGMIVDRNDEPLAKSVPVCSLWVDKNHLYDENEASWGLAYEEAHNSPDWSSLSPRDQSRRIKRLRNDILATESEDVIVQKHLAYAIGILARPLGMRKEDLRKRIVDNTGEYFTIAKDIPDDIAQKLRDIVDENRIHGFDFDGSLKRVYTSPHLATHVIGFTGYSERTDEDGNKHEEVVGKFGIESAMEEYLAGKDGWREYRRSTGGLRLPGDPGSLLPPRAGLNVQLTLDMQLQAIVEEELDAGLKEFNGERGAVVMMDPKTGEILAMASRPHFDLNRLETVSKNSYNFAIQAIYEPGSTIKIVAVSSALNEGLVSPQTKIFCHNGYFKDDNGAVVTDEHPKGTISVEEILKYSNNIGAYSLARQVGMNRFYDYQDRFGFGRKTGVSLSGESRGLNPKSRNPTTFSRAAFGYALSVTPLQMATAYCVIAGDGKLRKPHIVKSIVANDGTVVQRFDPEVVCETIKPKAAAEMRAALTKVTSSGGTATRANVQGFHVAGKTGTAQKLRADGKGYMVGHYILSFAGMMPAEDPAFVCYVVLDDPRPVGVGRVGGTTAGPIFSRIAARAAIRMNLQPSEPVSPPVATSASR